MCNPFESRHRRKLSKISSISRPRRGGTRSHAATSTSTHFDSDQYVTAESVPTRQWDLHPNVYCPQPCLVFLHDAPICMAQCFEALEHHRAEGCLYAKSIYCLQSSSTLSLKAGQHFRGAAWLQSTMSRRTASAAVSSCRPRSAAVLSRAWLELLAILCCPMPAIRVGHQWIGRVLPVIFECLDRCAKPLRGSASAISMHAAGFWG